jgi:hypothetical protein
MLFELNTSKCKFQITMYLLTQKMKVFTLILQQSHLLIREPTTFMIPVLPNNSHYGITYCIVYAQVIDVCVCVCVCERERQREYSASATIREYKALILQTYIKRCIIIQNNVEYSQDEIVSHS